MQGEEAHVKVSECQALVPLPALCSCVGLSLTLEPPLHPGAWVFRSGALTALGITQTASKQCASGIQKLSIFLSGGDGERLFRQ